MADSTTPVTPITDDLQINLAEAPKAEAPVTEPANTQSESNLDLDINLPEMKKNDDRLKKEDQKNMETTPTPIAETPVVSEPLEPMTKMEIKAPEAEEKQPEAVLAEEKQPEEAPIQEGKPSSTIVEISTEKKEDYPSDTLQKDTVIINELERHESAWGLAEEAKIETTPTSVEAPKTFDLDAMLGTPPPSPTEIPMDKKGNESEFETKTPETWAIIEQKTEPQQLIPNMAAEHPETWNLWPTNSMVPPAFTIPTPTSTVPIQAVTQVTIPGKKTTGVKTLLFVMLFVALGFTTYFILQTMYPIEFANMFRKNNTIQMHASEEVTGDMSTEEITGTTEIMTGSEEVMTGSEEVITRTTDTTNANFWELNTLDTEITTPSQEKTPISKLTDYVNQGNQLVEQGKAINNNTVIKYGLYISKKATDFLTKIANGEEINNLDWYFAQFDKYIEQLQKILGTESTTYSGIDVSSKPTTIDANPTEEQAPSAEVNPFATE